MANNPGTASSFRAVTQHNLVADDLGVLSQLPGQWSGHGFNLIARPDFSGGNLLFLELNLTKESLHFSTIGSPIPNRGSEVPDVNLFGVHYVQQISDETTGGALHIEPGIWLNIPADPGGTPPLGPTVARLATIPHGDAVNAQGTVINVAGPPIIKPANTVPFTIGAAVPAAGTPNGFPEYDLATPTTFRTDPLPATITQAMVNDPNSVLTAAVAANTAAGETFTNTDVLIVDTATNTGGVNNIPFVTENANAVQVSAIFWIETIQKPDGSSFLQLQYTQTVLLNFKGLSWPHVSVATLIKTF